MSQDKTGAGFVVRNELGKPIGVGALNLDGVTISVAEALALKEGLPFACRKDVKLLKVEGDSLLIINLVKGIWKSPWHPIPIIEDIKWLASKFLNIQWQHIFSEKPILWQISLLALGCRCLTPTFGIIASLLRR